jgi:hypothetical protein
LHLGVHLSHLECSWLGWQQVAAAALVSEGQGRQRKELEQEAVEQTDPRLEVEEQELQKDLDHKLVGLGLLLAQWGAGQTTETQTDRQMELERFDFARMIVGVEGWQS